jgi:formate hydrogenlyase subunit 4
MMNATVELWIHLLVLALLPPLLPGVIAKVKAWFAGRVGPPLLQLYYDLGKLLRKGAVYSKTTTWVFVAGPIVSLAALATAGLLVPLVGPMAPLGFAGDMVMFAYLLGLARFATVLAALDTGSSFEGMGGSREVAFGAVAEPALFLSLVVLAKHARSVQLSNALSAIDPDSWSVSAPALLMIGLSLLIVLLAENSRLPVDDPNTHLELTMIHEVMVLDHSGPDFAYILYGAALKLMLFGVLLVRLAIPLHRWPVWGAVPGLIASLVLLAVLVGYIESIVARIRLVHVPRLLLLAVLLASLGVWVMITNG